MGKVAVICINGGTWGIIKNLMEKKKLKFFKKIVKKGFFAKFCTVHSSEGEPEEFAQWGTIVTGVTPQQHDFKGRLDEIKVKCIWDYAIKYDKIIGLLNFIPSWPPPKINGFVVPSFSWSPEMVTFPTNLKYELESLKLKKINLPFLSKIEEKYLRKCVINEFNELEKMTTFYPYLKKKFNPDIFLIGFFGPDHLQHVFWKYMFPREFNCSFDIKGYDLVIPYFYELLDKFLSKIMKDFDNIFIIFDHDFKAENPPLELYLLDLNSLLTKSGFLHRKNGIDYSKTIAYSSFGIHIHRKVSSNGNVLIDGEKRKVYVKDGYMKYVLKFFRNAKVGNIQFFKVKKGKDGIIISVNLKLFNRICKNLKRIKIELGNKKYKLVEFFDVYEHSGEHGNEGMFMAYGKNIEKGYLNKISMLSIMPTILHSLKIPMNKEFRKRVLNIFR